MTMKPSHSIQERSEVAKVIGAPLTGQRVMVPMTSKAFFAGTLQPDILQPEKSGTGKEEEQLVMHVGKDYYVEMSRPEAIKHLSIPPTKTTTTKTQAAEPKRTIIKPAIKNNDDSETRANNQKHHNQTQSVAAAPTGFFEIREEYDSQGREIKAEAVDVAQELQYLQKKSENSANENSVSDESSTRKLDQNEELSSSLFEEHHEEVEEKKTLADVSNEDYDALSSRLEELARLEEEAGKKQKTNIKSSKKLQSKSWGKGFLDGPKKSKSNQSDDWQKNPTKKSSSEGGWGKGFLNSPKKSEKSVKKVAHGQGIVSSRGEGQLNKSATPTVSESTTRKVGFQQNNQVREIPRIGQRSAADLRPQNSRIQPAGSTRISTKPLEKNIFNGVVKERPVADTLGGPRSETAPAPRKKKLSKFAQERQMQHQ